MKDSIGISPYDFMELDPQCSVGYGNTHAQNTYSLNNGKNGKVSIEYPIKKVVNSNYDMKSLIDWFDVTFDQDYYNLDFVITLLFKYFDLPYYSSLVTREDNETLWSFNVKKEQGYGKSLSYGHIAVFYDDYGNIDKGIKLSFSGQGCREAELLFHEGLTWYDFFLEVSQLHVNIKRLDIAVDDYKGYFDIGHLKELALNGYMVSKFKTFEPRGKHLTKDGTSLGHSLYLGSTKSRLMIRFYEKGKEQGIADPNHVWNRTELQLRNERAEQALFHIVQDSSIPLGQIALGMLKNYVRFCDPANIGNESNRSRWKSFDWWEEFLQGVGTLKLATELPKSNIETKHKWIFDKISKSLAMLGLAYNEEDNKQEWLQNALYYGLNKLEDKDYKLIEKYKEDKKRAYSENYRQSDILDMKI